MCLDTGTTILIFVGVFIFITIIFYALVADSLEGSKDMIPRGDHDTNHATEMPFHSIAIRILSSYMQVSGMLLAFDFYVPGPVRALVSAQSAVSSLGEQLLTFECLVTSRQDSTLFFMKQTFAAWILPSGAGLIIAVIWWGRHCFCQRDGNDDEAHILRVRVSKTKDKDMKEKTRSKASAAEKSEPHQIYVFVPSVDGFITTLVVLFYTLYPSLVNRMALTFSCVSWDKGETDVLTEALSVKCWTPAHMALISQVGIPGSLLYMFLIPMLISLILRHQRKQQRLYPHQNRYEPRWTMRFSFMFAGYREGFEWWESVVMARKCLFVLMAIFLRLYGPSAQVIASAMVLSLATSLHLQYRPYFDQGLNWLESMSLQTSLAQLLTAILANVLTHGRSNAGGKRVSSSASMGSIANLVVIIVFFLSSFVFFLAVFRETIRGSYETKGCIGNVARCCVSQCHRHVFGSDNVHMRNKKARRHSRRMKKGTRHLFSKFFKAMDRGIGEVKAQSVEEDHDKSLEILNERVVVKSRNSHRRLEQRLATRRASLAGGASKVALKARGGSVDGVSSGQRSGSISAKVEPIVSGKLFQESPKRRAPKQGGSPGAI
jgi:hypothetical protein